MCVCETLEMCLLQGDPGRWGHSRGWKPGDWFKQRAPWLTFEVSLPKYQLEDEGFTLPETNIFAPENAWLEYYFPIGEAYFEVQTVSFREGSLGVSVG